MWAGAKSPSLGARSRPGLHPASTVRCRHKPRPRPPQSRPGPHPPPAPHPHAPWPARGGGWGQFGVGRAGEAAAAAAQQAGPLLPGPPGREREPEAERTRRPGGWGGAGSGGGPSRNLAKYSRRIAPRNAAASQSPHLWGGAGWGFSKLGGTGRWEIPHFQYPAARRGSLGWASSGGGGGGGGQGPPKCAPGIPQPGVSEWGYICLRFRLAPRSPPPTPLSGTLSDGASWRFQPFLCCFSLPTPREPTEVGAAPSLAPHPGHPPLAAP